ncbi:histidine phosphatase family protein [Guptibacillus hwajinpoensis]|uniref:histidine phosphatase family protein n=1 Tax=Guptibacillus hwajinpoensis TaxID=208199 RepID=UPI0024B3938D|nr:histidine phosphatase family protein [Pseudalkalibacillus hwajinpoensis]
MDERVAITLFRHGITDDNKRGAYIGWTDTPLNEAAELATVDADQYDLIFTSDLQRCMQTAKRLFPNRKRIPVPLLREILFGEWEGKTYADLEHDIQYRSWIDDPFTISPPGGENYAQFGQRIEEGFKSVVEQVIESQNQRGIVITHGGVIRYLLTKYAPEKRSFWEWKVPHGSGIELEGKRDDLRRDMRCTSLQEVPITANRNG